MPGLLASLMVAPGDSRLLLFIPRVPEFEGLLHKNNNWRVVLPLAGISFYCGDF